MSTFDVRSKEITSIEFADKFTTDMKEIAHAYKVKPFVPVKGTVSISDSEYDSDDEVGYVVVSSAEHAKNLIKALEKAIELGWIK